MKCFEIAGDKVVSGFSFTKPDSGRPYVLVGHMVINSSPIQSFLSEDGVRVYLSAALAASLTLADERIMEAELVKLEDGSCELDRPTRDGALVLHKHKLASSEVEIVLPGEARPNVQRRSVLGGMYFFERHHFELVGLRPDESISVITRRSRKVPGTGPTLFHPLRKAQWEPYVVGTKKIVFRDNVLTVESC